MSTINNLNWRCFLALEQELENTKYFVEVSEENYKTYSIKYRSIINQACADIDILFKRICGKNQSDRCEIQDYIHFINTHHKNFSNIEVHIPVYNMNIKPWASFEKKEPPQFWMANNKIKHAGEIQKATLKNSIDSLAALFALLLAWCGTGNKNFLFDPAIQEPILFWYEGIDVSYSAFNGGRSKLIVPGFITESDHKKAAN